MLFARQFHWNTVFSKDYMTRANSIKERIHPCEPHDSFEIAALILLPCRWGKKSGNLKTNMFFTEVSPLLYCHSSNIYLIPSKIPCVLMGPWHIVGAATFLASVLQTKKKRSKSEDFWPKRCLVMVYLESDGISDGKEWYFSGQPNERPSVQWNCAFKGNFLII